MKCCTISWQLAASTVNFRKHSRQTPSGDIPPNHWLKPHTGLGARWILFLSSSLLPDSGTVFFCPAQVRRLCHCLWFMSGLTLRMQHLHLISRISLCIVALDVLTPTSSILNVWAWQSYQKQQLFTLLVHLFLPLQFLWIRLDTALWTPSILSNDVLGLTLLVRDVNDGSCFNYLFFESFRHLLSQLSSPWLWAYLSLSPLTQTERPLQVFQVNRLLRL